MSSSSFSPSVLTLPATSQQLELNIVTNPTAATSPTDKWTVSGMSVTRDATGSPLDPLVPTGFNMSSTANGQTFTTVALTVPSTLMNKKLKVEFYYTYVSGTSFTLDVLDGADVHYNLTTDVSGTTTLPQTSGKFTAYFDSNNTTSLKVRFSSTGTGVTKFTQLIVGPGIQPQGGAIDATFSYTPTLDGFGTGATISRAVWTRRGTKMRLEGRISAGTPTAGSLKVSIPSGYTMSTIAIDSKVGTATRQTTTPLVINVLQRSTDNASIYFGTNLSSATGATLLGASEPLSYECEVEIAEWSTAGTVNVAQNDVEFAWNSDTGTAAGTTYSTSSFYGYGPAGTPIRSVASTTTTGESKTLYTVQFQTPVQAEDQVIVELNDGNGWFDASQRFSTIANNTASYGINLIAVNNRTYRVGFGNAGYNPAQAATYGSAGSSWNALATATPAWRWRVRKASAGSAVGFGIVQGTSAGLVPGSNTNFDDVTATRLGLKQYLHGTTYNGGIAPTVTSAQGGFAVEKAIFIPYQLNDGSWRVKISMRCTFTSATITTIDLTVNGIAFNTTIQAGVTFFGGLQVGTRCYVQSATAIRCDMASNTTSAVTLAADFELTAKPTWAY